MSQVRELADHIDNIYANLPWYPKPERRKDISYYSYCGWRLDMMNEEAASNILQTRFSGY